VTPGSALLEPPPSPGTNESVCRTGKDAANPMLISSSGRAEIDAGFQNSDPSDSSAKPPV